MFWYNASSSFITIIMPAEFSIKIITKRNVCAMSLGLSAVVATMPISKNRDSTSQSVRDWNSIAASKTMSVKTSQRNWLRHAWNSYNSVSIYSNSSFPLLYSSFPLSKSKSKYLFQIPWATRVAKKTEKKTSQRKWLRHAWNSYNFVSIYSYSSFPLSYFSFPLSKSKSRYLFRIP